MSHNYIEELLLVLLKSTTSCRGFSIRSLNQISALKTSGTVLQAIRVAVGVEADVEASVQEHWLVWGP